MTAWERRLHNWQMMHPNNGTWAWVRAREQFILELLSTPNR